MRTTSISVGVVIVAVSALTGCVASPPTVETTPGPTVTVTITATPAPTATAAARNARTPFDEWDAYLACTNLSLSFYEGDKGFDPTKVKFAGFDKAQIVLRNDKNFYVYVEATNNNSSTAAGRDIASECIVGGTLGKPVYDLFGNQTRIPIADRDPNITPRE